jgi:hypothetical protein
MLMTFRPDHEQRTMALAVNYGYRRDRMKTSGDAGVPLPWCCFRSMQASNG